jgi:hypothetical protein
LRNKGGGGQGSSAAPTEPAKHEYQSISDDVDKRDDDDDDFFLAPPDLGPSLVSRGRCNDHNFRRLFPIFGEKNGVFLKYQCYGQRFSKFSFVLSQKRQFFRKKVSAKIFLKS